MSEGLQVSPDAIDPNVGMVLQDRYRIIRKVGEGGMGAVYEAEHILIKRRVAIKCLHAQFATHPEIVTRFHREALAVTSIGHQNIVEVTDMGRFPDQSVFMVLEFLQGRDWAEDLDAGVPQTVGKVVGIMEQVCDALQAAHDKDIVHRDMKPENLLLSSSDDTSACSVLADFGLSEHLELCRSGKGPTGTQLVGTLAYNAPEHLAAAPHWSAAGDVWAAGIVLFIMLSGSPPFYVNERLAKHVHDAALRKVIREGKYVF